MLIYIFVAARRQPEQILPAGPDRGRVSLLLRGSRQWRQVQAAAEPVRGQEQQVGLTGSLVEYQML